MMPIDYLKDSLEEMGFDIEEIEYPNIIAMIMENFCEYKKRQEKLDEDSNS